MVNEDHVEDDKLLPKLRLISKESAMGADAVNPPPKICTYYGGVSAGVPFHWESKPGTPKHSSSETTSSRSSLFPPLNPPPCYTSSNVGPIWGPPIKRRSKSFAIRSLFQKKLPDFITRKRSQRTEAMSSSSSSNSSASSAPSSPVRRPVSVFGRSQSTSIRRNSVVDSEFYDENTSSISRGSTDCSPRCFWR